jgi:hypothetical protein
MDLLTDQSGEVGMAEKMNLPTDQFYLRNTVQIESTNISIQLM